MYIVCGVIVFLFSVWLFIGNVINYRLFVKEKKLVEVEKIYKFEFIEFEFLSKFNYFDVNV